MRTFFVIISIIIALFIINNLLRSIYDIWQKQDLVTKTETELKREKDQHASLQKKLKIVKDPQFIEGEARNKLFLVKPNEEVIVLPSTSPKISPQPTAMPVNTKDNWEQWKDLFFPTNNTNK